MEHAVGTTLLDQYRLRDNPVCVSLVADEHLTGGALSTGLHRHEFNELVIILSGRSIHVTELGEYPVSAGDVFIIMAGEAHGYRDSHHLALANVLYLPEIMRADPADLGGLPGFHALFTLEPRYRHQHQLQSCLSLDTGALTQARHLIGRVAEENRAAQPGFRFLTRALFMELVTLLSRAYGESRRETTRPLLSLGAVLGHIERHMADPVSLTDLAGLANMSESTLLRAFRKAMGVSPIEYLLRLRVARAARLLAKTELRIGEVARQAGFSDSNYFARQFRRLQGVTPTAWRRQAAGRP